jgi:cob(I)alamin adenosyltransferase
MAKLYTGNDHGITNIKKGRISKSSPIIRLLNKLDLFMTEIGLVLYDRNINHQPIINLKSIYEDLFNISSTLAGYTKLKGIDMERIELIENAIDLYQDRLPPLTNFIILNGPYARLRVICRECEVLLWYAINKEIDLECSPVIPTYLNRLSDYFFMLSRKYYPEKYLMIKGKVKKNNRIAQEKKWQLKYIYSIIAVLVLLAIVKIVLYF